LSLASDHVRILSAALVFKMKKSDKLFVEAEQEENELYISFSSAWSPPLRGYKNLRKLGYEIHAMYYESGMCFCGIWDEGDDEYYQIDEPDSQEWLDANIPETLLEEMGIEAWIED